MDSKSHRLLTHILIPIDQVFHYTIAIDGMPQLMVESSFQLLFTDN